MPRESNRGVTAIKHTQHQQKQKNTPTEQAAPNARSEKPENLQPLVRVFPHVASLERLATAILMAIDEDWTTSAQPYINWRAAPPPSMENQNDENERV